jgi:hypothetical protein
MDITLPVVAGLALMPTLISGPMTSSVGTSICAGCANALPCGYVVARTSPVYQLPCGSGYGHSTAYNYGVYPVQEYLYSTPRSTAAARYYGLEK